VARIFGRHRHRLVGRLVGRADRRRYAQDIRGIAFHRGECGLLTRSV
jgi:hypothetical protein